MAHLRSPAALVGNPSDYPYPSFPFTTIAAFRSVADVAGVGGGGTVSDQAMADSPYGATAVQLAANGNNGTISPAAVLSSPINVQNGSIRITWKPIYNLLNNLSNISVWSVDLFSAGTPASPGSNYHSVSFGQFRLYSTAGGTNGNGRYQTSARAVQAFSAVGSGADLTAIKWARLRFTGGNTIVMGLGDIDFVPNPRSKAALIFRFDDCYASAYTVAFPRLQAVNAPGFLAPGAPAALGIGVGGSGRLTWEQIAEMRGAGWQFGAQFYSTETGATIEGWTEEQRIAEWSAMRNQARPVGCYRDTADGSNGTTSPIIRRTKDLACRTAQGFYNGDPVNPPFIGETFPFGDPRQILALNLNAVGGNASPKWQYAQYALERVRAQKGVLILAAHNELNSPGESLEAFEYAIDYAANQYADEVEITTIRRLLAPYNGDDLQF